MHPIEILLVLLHAPLAIAQGTNSSLFPNWQSSWITGGTDAAPAEFPYMVLIKLDDKYCGGAIISNLNILTAAHCIAGLPISSVAVVVGINIIRRGDPRSAVAGVIIHPAFDRPTLQNDIAIIKLQEPIVYGPTAQPIPLPNQGEITPVGTQCVITGWGFVEGSGTKPGFLQKLQVNTIANSEAQVYCQPIYDTDVCTFAGIGKGTNFGDSGGPLVCGGKLTGVLTGSIQRTCRDNQVSIYAGVSNYITWINQNAT